MPKSKKFKDSEFRLYDFISQSLKELGWVTKNPSRYPDGEVYTQNECLQNKILKQALGKDRPENVIVIGENSFWVIEAKTGFDEIETAIDKGKSYAKKINALEKVQCRFITGVAGDIESTYIVETWFLTNKKEWKKVSMNGMEITGFLSKEQTLKIIANNDSNLDNEEIPDSLFMDKANNINDTLQNGAIVKKNRAKVIASLLLALVEDPYFRISDDPTTLIEDVNSRVKALLRKHDKQNFAQEIAISLPTSKDNHKKSKSAISKTIQELRSLNIRSAINSGKDILGQFYEVFLKYANDAKEIGIVLTPRHITKFAAQVMGITVQDYIYDPTCGTGGFLVSALDKVKQSLPNGKNIEPFKQSHIYGIEQEPEIVGLALVNMIFRRDGKSNIIEGNCFDNYFLKTTGNIKQIKKEVYAAGVKKGVQYERFITRTLMNPPFALKDEEYKFVQHAMQQMVDGGLLFAVVPTSVMTSSNDGGEMTWRKKMLENHTLKAVIKLSEELFQPNAHKGTYIIVIQTWIPHDNKKVFWAIMDDGFTMVKAKRLPSHTQPSNMNFIEEQLRNFILAESVPKQIEGVLGYTKIDLENKSIDLSPEHHLPMDNTKQVNFSQPIKSLYSYILNSNKSKVSDVNGQLKYFKITDIIESMTRGDCAPLNSLPAGETPIVTTTEANNGISNFLSPNGATIFKNRVTIPANGSKYIAFYHPYEFAANADVLVCNFKSEYDTVEMKLYFCSVYNKNSWRFSWFRKGTEDKVVEDLSIPIPVKNDGTIDKGKIREYLQNVPEYSELIKLIKDSQ